MAAMTTTSHEQEYHNIARDGRPNGQGFPGEELQIDILEDFWLDGKEDDLAVERLEPDHLIDYAELFDPPLDKSKLHHKILRVRNDGRLWPSKQSEINHYTVSFRDGCGYPHSAGDVFGFGQMFVKSIGRMDVGNDEWTTTFVLQAQLCYVRKIGVEFKWTDLANVGYEPFDMNEESLGTIIEAARATRCPLVVLAVDGGGQWSRAMVSTDSLDGMPLNTGSQKEFLRLKDGQTDLDSVHVCCKLWRYVCHVIADQGIGFHVGVRGGVPRVYLSFGGFRVRIRETSHLRRALSLLTQSELNVDVDDVVLSDPIFDWVVEMLRRRVEDED